MITRPMLAGKIESAEKLELIEWPAFCSPKVDGIRCLIHPSLGPVTRSFKPVPNDHIYGALDKLAGQSYLDGELIAVDENRNDLSFNETQSAVMTHDGQPDFVFAVFDCFQDPDQDFMARHVLAQKIVGGIGVPQITILEHVLVRSLEEFIGFAEKCVEGGFEGSIIRSPAGIYKSGRSTFNQGWLLKYKNWVDTEGTVIGFNELMRNDNPDVGDKFGLAKRSSHKANMVPMHMLGALVLMTEWGELRVGSGFTMAQRQEIWLRNMDVSERYRNKDAFAPDIGRKVTFKYQPFGMQDKPRFPIFKSFRLEDT